MSLDRSTRRVLQLWAVISKVRIGVTVIVVGIIAAFVFVLSSGNSAKNPSKEATNSTSSQSSANSSEVSSSSEPTSTLNPGQYIEYSSEKLSSTSGQKVLFFHAPWCPQCRSIDKGITADAIPANTTIFKVDYDSNQELRKKYGVTLQTTFVVLDDNQNLVKKHVGYDEPTFDAVKKALF